MYHQGAIDEAQQQRGIDRENAVARAEDAQIIADGLAKATRYVRKAQAELTRLGCPCAEILDDALVDAASEIPEMA